MHTLQLIPDITHMYTGLPRISPCLKDDMHLTSWKLYELGTTSPIRLQNFMFLCEKSNFLIGFW